MTSAPWPRVASFVARDEILGAIVDRAIRAEPQARGGLFVRADGRDHLRAERLGEHYRRGADAGGSAVNQQGFAGPQAAALENVGPDGEKRFRDRRRFDVVSPSGIGRALVSCAIAYSA